MPGQFKQRRRVAQHLLAPFFGFCVKTPRHQLREVLIQSPNRRADGHVVVVQDDEQIALAGTGVVHCFVSHAGGERAIADDRHGLALASCLFGGNGHAESGRDAG